MGRSILMEAGRQVGGWLRRRLGLPEPPTPLVIRTDRLVLRDLNEDDLERLLRHQQDPLVLRYLAWTEPRTREEVWQVVSGARYCQWQEPRGRYDLGIILPDTGELIGEVGLDCMYPDEITREPNAATIGFLLQREHWGRGYATEAAGGVIRFGFEALRIPWIFGACHPENAGSRRVLEKLGMTLQDAQADFPGSPPQVASLVFALERDHRLAQSSPPPLGR